MRGDYELADWQRLGRAVNFARRHKQLGDTKRWVDATDVSDRTLLGLERGERVGPRTLERIEEALEWPAGRCLEILQGLLPVTVAGDVDAGWPVAPGPAFADFRRDELRKVELLQRITVLSRELAEASLELTQLEQLEERGFGQPLAAYRPGTTSRREALDAAQDEAAEAPDAPGSEHGA